MCMYIKVQSKLSILPCQVFLKQLTTNLLLSSCFSLLLSSFPVKYGFAMSDKSTLSLMELLSIYSSINERDILSFSAPAVSKKSLFHSCYKMWMGNDWDTVADIGNLKAKWFYLCESSQTNL